MERISDRVVRHDPVLDVSGNDFSHRILDRQQRQIIYQLNGVLFIRIITPIQFIENCDAGYKRVIISGVIPPLACLLSTGCHIRLSTNLVIEARNGSFDINLWLHKVEGYTCGER